jgi:hypothetical protein
VTETLTKHAAIIKDMNAAMLETAEAMSEPETPSTSDDPPGDGSIR